MNNIEKIAKKNNVPAETIRKEIAEAIRIGMSNPDIKVKQAWHEMFPNGEEPSPEEFIQKIVDKIL